ncbi:dTDP-4-dehydrorhamnose 3,5-epimerase [Pseudonocardia sp. Ae406_Ps2]|nr:dTDP-4-dehydrorhamnose 3,5-epimerase [Pseudonocardia sp. Ae331_Ps2]OLM05203.1 dTDP-4-dehydrorhamnose 3,5-epimerase [Pseudonocardia sp. Ae406_Ps2]OLM26774.1 dTDP-4-dehydrorhamnose 3,5-epimerase [Pseudonocardia sp. Ae706_Ps2]
MRPTGPPAVEEPLMDVETTAIEGVLLFRPRPFRDDRGFFSRTYDDAVARQWGITRADYVQDSQSRSGHGVLRGLHGRNHGGEGKIIRVAHGAAHLVVVDGRLESPTLGRHVAVRLDDRDLVSIRVPRRMLVGLQVVGEVADVCYAIDRVHDPIQAVSVHWADPDLGVDWPMPPSATSERDRVAPSWADYLRTLDGAPVEVPSTRDEGRR